MRTPTTDEGRCIGPAPTTFGAAPLDHEGSHADARRTDTLAPIIWEMERYWDAYNAIVGDTTIRACLLLFEGPCCSAP